MAAGEYYAFNLVPSSLKGFRTLSENDEQDAESREDGSVNELDNGSEARCVIQFTKPILLRCGIIHRIHG
jgi:hypothetical protein